MFDIGFSELLLLSIISLVVLGPERLPHAARLAGAWVGRARRVFFDLKHQIEAEVQAKELQDRLLKLQAQIDASINTLTPSDSEPKEPNTAVDQSKPAPTRPVDDANQNAS